jgi:hypothetical protein
MIQGACGGDEASTTTTSAATSGGPSETVLEGCTKFCNAKSSAGCETVEECTKGCNETAAKSPYCDSPFAAQLACAADYITLTGMCEVTPENACKAEYQAWFMCVSLMGCSDLSGSGSSGTCTQEGTCEGVAYKAECGDTTCNCFKANELAGTCAVNSEACNIREGCCSSFFFP